MEKITIEDIFENLKKINEVFKRTDCGYYNFD